MEIGLWLKEENRDFFFPELYLLQKRKRKKKRKEREVEGTETSWTNEVCNEMKAKENTDGELSNSSSTLPLIP